MITVKTSLAKATPQPIEDDEEEIDSLIEDKNDLDTTGGQ